MRKRIWATFLVLCLVLGMLPGTAWAAEVEDLSTPMDVFGEEPGIWEELEEPAGSAAQADGPISGTCGENATWTLPGGTLTISGSGPMGVVYDFWANQGRTITSVVISSGITSIGERAFWGCTNLTDVTIPDSVTSIEGTAFHSCTSLTDITIPDSVTSIKGSAFYNCTNLISVFIPSSVMKIESSTFDGCSSLTAIHVARGNPNYASMDGVLLSKNLDTLLIYPRGKQGPYSIPESVGDISYRAFSGCSGLTDVTIPDSVTSIRDYAFYGCTNLTDVAIPDSVTSIGGDAFRDCASLKAVTIPDSVTLIAGNAFLDCASLTSVFIPSSVMKIGTNSFSGCSSLTTIQVDRKNPNYASMDGILLSKRLNNLLSYPGGKRGSYSIPDSVTSIEKGAFSKCTGLAEVIIPNSVTDIKDYAFIGCTGLTDVIIPGSITSIGERSFDGCTSLTDVTILNNVTSIEEYAFRGCTNLTNITIPDSVTNIGEGAFFYCPSLTDVYYGGSESEWEDISIGSRNDPLTSATIHYNSPGLDTPDTPSGSSKIHVSFGAGDYLGGYMDDSSYVTKKPTISDSGDTVYLPAGAKDIDLAFSIPNMGSIIFSDGYIIDDEHLNSNLILIEGDCGLTAKPLEFGDTDALIAFDGTARPGSLDITCRGFALEDDPGQLLTDKDGHLVTSNTLHVVVQGDDTPPTLQKQPTPTNVSFSKGVLSWTPTFVGSKDPDNDGAVRWCKLDFKNVDTHEERTVTLSCLHGMTNKYAITNTDWPSGTYTVQITSLARPYLDTTTDSDPTLPYRFVYTKPNGYLPCVEDCAWKTDSFPAMTWNYDANRLADVKEFRIFPRVAELEDGVYKDFVHLYLDNWEGSLSVAPSADGIYTSQDLETAVKAHGEGWYVFEVMAISNNDLWMDGDIKSCRADYHYVPSTSIIQGDLNGDGKVTMADVIRLARGASNYVTLTEQERRMGDVNGDGKITMADVIRVARFAAGYSPTL